MHREPSLPLDRVKRNSRKLQNLGGAEGFLEARGIFNWVKSRGVRI